MGKGSSSPPQVDAQALIQQQAQQNRINQFTPQGNLIFGSVNGQGQFNPSGGQASAYLEESPFQRYFRQGREDLAATAQQSAAARMQNLPLAGIDISQYPERQYGIDFSKVDAVPTQDQYRDLTQQAQSAVFDQGRALLDPVFQQNERRLDTKLANQGLPVGSEAYDTDFGNFRREQNQAYTNLANQSVSAGNALQSQLFNQGLAGRNAQIQDQNLNIGLNNANRAQGIQEQQSLRSTDLSELASLLGLQPVQQVQASNFFAPGQVDVMGPAALSQQAAMAQYQQGQQANNSLYQGLFGLGGAAIGAICWVAREVYGDDRWLKVREWMLDKAPEWLRSAYLEHGEEAARMIRNKPATKWAIRQFMDEVVNG